MSLVFMFQKTEPSQKEYTFSYMDTKIWFPKMPLLYRILKEMLLTVEYLLLELRHYAKSILDEFYPHTQKWNYPFNAIFLLNLLFEINIHQYNMELCSCQLLITTKSLFMKPILLWTCITGYETVQFCSKKSKWLIG